MTEWIVRRWKRHGHDRLYASTPGGTDLGYLDMVSGRFHSDDLSNLPLLRKAIEDHLAVQERARSRVQSAPPSVAPVPAPEAPIETSVATPAAGSTVTAPAQTASAPSSPPVVAPMLSTPSSPPMASPVAPAEVPDPMTGREWHDLADARAGAAARERAIAERQAQGLWRHLFARMIDARTDERAWRIGADGEEAVAEKLDRLGPEWRVLHAVRVGTRGADIDHVVIGPGGVFTVNTKHHPKASVWVGGETFMVNGRRVPYVRNSRYEAKRASRKLADHVGFPVPVTGVVAVVGARRGFTVKSQPSDGAVVVVPRLRIGRFFRSRPRRLGLREIDAIHEVARRSTTWQR